MRIKVYLKPSRDIELIAVRYNPALDFSGIAREVLKNHVRGKTYKFSIPENSHYAKKPLLCYVTLDDKDDADVIKYLDGIIISRSALVRNLMLQAISNDLRHVYTDGVLKAAVVAQELERQRQNDLRQLKRRLELGNRQ